MCPLHCLSNATRVYIVLSCFFSITDSVLQILLMKSILFATFSAEKEKHRNYEDAQTKSKRHLIFLLFNIYTMVDPKQFLSAIKKIASEKSIEEEVILDAVKSAFAAAYKRDFGSKDLEVKVELDENSPELAKIYVLKEVVDDGDVLDENLEIDETSAKAYDEEAEVGDELYIDSTPEGYGRIAAQSAKQVILQKIQEASRKSLFEKFKDKEGEVVIASINRVEGNHVFVDTEGTTVMLAEKHRIKKNDISQENDYGYM